jgi:hypothetical protein
MYALLADLIVAFHLAYVAFAVGGELLILIGGIAKWEWVKNLPFRIVHLIAVVFVALEALIGMICPLTKWEYNLRRMAGQSAEEDITFVGRLIRMIIFYDFPNWFFTLLYVGFGGLVVLTLLLVPPKRKNKKTDKKNG